MTARKTWIILIVLAALIAGIFDAETEIALKFLDAFPDYESAKVWLLKTFLKELPKEMRSKDLKDAGLAP